MSLYDIVLLVGLSSGVLSRPNTSPDKSAFRISDSISWLECMLQKHAELFGLTPKVSVIYAKKNDINFNLTH